MEDTKKSNAIPTLETDELDAKVVERFRGKIVRKDLTALMKRGANVPTFVLEYLLGMYCSTDDDEAVAQGVARIRRILTENYVRPDESEAIKSKIRENGVYTIIDKVRAHLDEYKDLRCGFYEPRDRALCDARGVCAQLQQDPAGRHLVHHAHRVPRPG